MAEVIDFKNGSIDEEKIEPKTYDIDYFVGDGSGDTKSMTVTGFLAVTPDFIAVADKDGRIVFYMPSGIIQKAQARPDAASTEIN